jgi:hypothetical protein
MRVRDHIVLSTTGAALARPRLGNRALGFWAGSVLIDADHYLWFCLRERSWKPTAAMRFFNEANPPQHRATRLFHGPLAPLALILLGLRRRALLWVGLGMLAHIALDLQHETRMDKARAAALVRDGFTCQVCGARAPDVGTHLRSQPWLLPSYEADNLIALCEPCHELAHADRGRAG